MSAAKTKFGSLLLLLQGILLILFIVFVDYGDEFKGTKENDSDIDIDAKLPAFQNLQLMAFLGFGLIATFLRRYSRGMLIHAFLIGGLVVQWATLLQGFFTMKNTKIELSIDRMINADYAVLVVLISFGAVVGKTNSLQLLIIALVETFFFSVNEAISLNLLKITDHGRSIIVHLFAAVFGLAVSRMIYSRRICMSHALSTSNKSEMYSLIGTIVLWVYWPMLNASNVGGSAKRRAIANSYYALAASCITTFSLTVFTSKGHFNILHIQNASIAGGVAIGAVSTLMIGPWGSIILGILGAFSSVMAYKYLVPKFRRKFKIHDVRGINAAHGVPAIVSGLASIGAAFIASVENYGTSLYTLYPARVPKQNTTEFISLTKINPNILSGENRSNYMQGLYQLIGMLVTLFISALGGVLAGLSIRSNFFEPVSVHDAFDDHGDFQEANCIDACSDDEFEDDNEKHHDSIHGNKRLLDTDHHSDIVATNDTPYAIGQHYGNITPKSNRKSELADDGRSYRSSVHSIGNQSPKISNDKLNTSIDIQEPEKSSEDGLDLDLENGDQIRLVVLDSPQDKE